MNFNNFKPLDLKVTKLPPNSQSVIIICKKVFDAKPSETSKKNGPSTIMGVLMETKTFNRLDKKDREFEDSITTMTCEAGISSSSIRMFNAPPMVEGELYLLQGVNFDSWLGGNYDTPLRSLRATAAIPYTKTSIHSLIRDVPFKNRCFDLKRDFPDGDSGEYDVKETYRFFAIDVRSKCDRFEPNTLVGRFSLPKQNDVSWYLRTPKDREPCDVLCGGVDKKNQMIVCQTDENGDTKSFLVCTILYEDSIKRFQCDWLALGHVLMKHQSGTAICSLDRAGTNSLQVAYNGGGGEIQNVCSARVSFHPNLMEMVRAAGFRIVSWENACRIDPNLRFPKQMRSTKKHDLTWSQIVNILDFDGDVSGVQEAMERGWVELFLVCNHTFKDSEVEAIQIGPENEMIEKMLDGNNFPGETLEDAKYALYAVETEDSPCHATHFVCPTGQKFAQGSIWFASNVSPSKRGSTSSPSSSENGREGEEEEVNGKRVRFVDDE